MLVLSLDSSGSSCAACVWQDGKTLALTEEKMDRGQDARLIPIVLDVMKKAQVEFEALDRLAVARGPGSFTGLRIGLAAAQGLGLAAGKPVVGIDRFSLYRKQNEALSDNLLVVLQSKRLELFCRFYPLGDEPERPLMLPPEDIVKMSMVRGPFAIAGDSADLLRPHFPVTTLFRPLCEPEIVTNALLASRADLNNPEAKPTPLYIREPDVTMPRHSCSIDNS